MTINENEVVDSFNQSLFGSNTITNMAIGTTGTSGEIQFSAGLRVSKDDSITMETESGDIELTAAVLKRLIQMVEDQYPEDSL